MTKLVLVGVCLSMLAVGCGHTMSHQVGLMSFGDLEGRTLPETAVGHTVREESCAWPADPGYALSQAVRYALENTEYDTLVDVTVTNRTNWPFWANCIKVEGKGLHSGSLAQLEDDQ